MSTPPLQLRRHGALYLYLTICPPGFNLPRRLWSTLNRFRTGQGRCAANLVRWHHHAYVETLDRQWIISSIAVQLHGGLWSLRQAGKDAVSWLGTQKEEPVSVSLLRGVCVGREWETCTDGAAHCLIAGTFTRCHSSTRYLTGCGRLE